MTNRIEDIKGIFHHWTDESIVWYQRASDYTGYHKNLIPYILPWLTESDTCCELACGTGALARSLAPYTGRYTANDADPAAIRFNRAMLKEESSPENLELAEGDWKEVLRGRRFDTVLFSFFGALISNWEDLKTIAKRQIIVIAGRRPADDARSDRKTKQEYAEDIVRFLQKKNIETHLQEITLEFGQPLEDMEEARRYVGTYYRLQGDEAGRFLKNKLVKLTDGSLYFPKQKKMGIVSARLPQNG